MDPVILLIIIAIYTVGGLVYASFRIHQSVKRRKNAQSWTKSKETPKPVLENTQKVHPPTSERTVIRRTQFRGKTRKKF